MSFVPPDEAKDIHNSNVFNERLRPATHSLASFTTARVKEDSWTVQQQVPAAACNGLLAHLLANGRIGKLPVMTTAGWIWTVRGKDLDGGKLERMHGYELYGGGKDGLETTWVHGHSHSPFSLFPLSVRLVSCFLRVFSFPAFFPCASACGARVLTVCLLCADRVVHACVQCVLVTRVS